MPLYGQVGNILIPILLPNYLLVSCIRIQKLMASVWVVMYFYIPTWLLATSIMYHMNLLLRHKIRPQSFVAPGQNLDPKHATKLSWCLIRMPPLRQTDRQADRQTYSGQPKLQDCCYQVLVQVQEQFIIYLIIQQVIYQLQVHCQLMVLSKCKSANKPCKVN